MVGPGWRHRPGAESPATMSKRQIPVSVLSSNSSISVAAASVGSRACGLSHPKEPAHHRQPDKGRGLGRLGTARLPSESNVTACAAVSAPCRCARAPVTTRDDGPGRYTLGTQDACWNQFGGKFPPPPLPHKAPPRDGAPGDMDREGERHDVKRPAAPAMPCVPSLASAAVVPIGPSSADR